MPNLNPNHLHRVDKNEDGRITEEEVKEVHFCQNFHFLLLIKLSFDNQP